MHVVEGDGEKPSSPAAGEAPDKGVSVGVASTTVDDNIPAGAAEASPGSCESPKLNGICDSLSDDGNKSRRNRDSLKGSVIFVLFTNQSQSGT